MSKKKEQPDDSDIPVETQSEPTLESQSTEPDSPAETSGLNLSHSPAVVNPLANMIAGEILALADSEDVAIKERFASERQAMRERHVTEKDAHEERQKYLKALAAVAPKRIEP